MIDRGRFVVDGGADDYAEHANVDNYDSGCGDDYDDDAMMQMTV